MESEVVTVPLRSIWKKASRWNRASRAVKEVRQTLKKKFRAEEVKIGSALNEKIWSRGGKKPPRKVRVVIIDEGDGQYYAELSTAELGKRRKKKEEERKKEEKEPEGEEEEEEKSEEEKLKEKYMKRTPK